jgi:DNA-binding IscR family transcriptional regulator
VWQAVKAATEEVLNRTTLADLVGRPIAAFVPRA